MGLNVMLGHYGAGALLGVNFYLYFSVRDLIACANRFPGGSQRFCSRTEERDALSILNETHRLSRTVIVICGCLQIYQQQHCPDYFGAKVATN